MNKYKIEAVISAIFVIALFVSFSYFSQRYLDDLQGIILGYKLLGLIVYPLALALSIVLAPVSTLPLIAVASNLYGFWITGTLNFLGWFLGDIVAFAIARRFGKPIVKRLINIKKVDNFGKMLNKHQKFFTLILLRILFFPLDILSYALGLFTDVSWRLFLITTMIGILPFSFILAYFGLLSLYVQLIIFAAGLFVFFIVYVILVKLRKKY